MKPVDQFINEGRVGWWPADERPEPRVRLTVVGSLASFSFRKTCQRCHATFTSWRRDQARCWDCRKARQKA